MESDQNEYPDSWLVHNQHQIAGFLSIIILFIIIIWGYYYYKVPVNNCISTCDIYQHTYNDSGCFCTDNQTNYTVLAWNGNQ